MADLSDLDFLRFNEQKPVVPADQIKAAQERQREELAREGSCRSLIAILREHGLVDPVVEQELLTQRTPSGPVAPHTPTVVLTPEDDPSAVVHDRRGSSSEISTAKSARRLPPDVEVASKDPRNRLGPFILVREVGRGGMGRVYRSWEVNVGRIVALKVIDTEVAEDRERFVREAQIAGRLHHPMIAMVFQAGEEGTRGYIALQFIDGGGIDSQKRPLLTVLALIRDAARALSYAHEQGVVHRDVKPGNLLVDQDGRLFLTDFGLAKEVVNSSPSQLSITGTTFGTPQFMSPEQARGDHKGIDARSDIYSLGSTLYALLAGRPPFTTPNIGALLLDVIEKKPPPLSRFNREISPELEMIIERAMAKDRARRFPTMGAFAEALDRLIREGRYAGKFGTARMMIRRWLPRVTAAVVLGLAIRFGVPRLMAPGPAAPGGGPDPYSTAAIHLDAFEAKLGIPTADDRRRLHREVVGRVDELLAREPGNLRARVLKVRALYVAGDLEAAAKELHRLERRKGEDYRLSLVGALLSLGQALKEPCPLPAIEAPSPEWDLPPAVWPEALRADLKAIENAKVDPDLAPAYSRDAPMVKGIGALVEGWPEDAARILREVLRNRSLPVCEQAWVRAAYLARQFAAVRAEKSALGTPEWVGAGLGLALTSADPAAALEACLRESAADPRATGLIRAALARLDSGTDPRPWTSAAMASYADDAGRSREMRAALQAARLRWEALSGADDEKQYRDALALLGEAPQTRSGRLAAIELRLGLGARLIRSGGEGRAHLESALQRAKDLCDGAAGWAAPRVLRAAARLRLGKPEDARTDAEGAPGVRARLIAAAASLACAEAELKAKRPYFEEAQRARREARSIAAAAGDPPEALVIAAAAALLLAHQATESGKDGSELVQGAIDDLTRALKTLPGYAEARYHRARALFLRSATTPGAEKNGQPEAIQAAADLDAALAAVPGYQAARHLQGIVNFTLGRYAEAVADWRALIQADKAWDTEEVRSWIDLAQSRLKKGNP